MTAYKNMTNKELIVLDKCLHFITSIPARRKILVTRKDMAGTRIVDYIRMGFLKKVPL